MNKKNGLILVLCLAAILTVTAASAFYLLPSKTLSKTDSAFMQNIGNSSYGNVVKEGPYGNKDSRIKIAIIVGVHPLESDAHKAMIQAIQSDSKYLNYSYTIYMVNVTQDPDDYGKGRMNGQLLANKFAVPDIVNQKYDLTIDVHSNVGNWDKNRFIFAPVNGSSEDIGKNLSVQLNWLSYYVPPNPTSTVYVTEPLIKGGVPALVYETYHNDSEATINNHANDFLLKVDGLHI